MVLDQEERVMIVKDSTELVGVGRVLQVIPDAKGLVRHVVIR